MTTGNSNVLVVASTSCRNCNHNFKSKRSTRFGTKAQVTVMIIGLNAVLQTKISHEIN